MDSWFLYWPTTGVGHGHRAALTARSVLPGKVLGIDDGYVWRWRWRSSPGGPALRVTRCPGADDPRPCRGGSRTPMRLMQLAPDSGGDRAPEDRLLPPLRSDRERKSA